MICVVLDSVMWGSMARLNFDVTSDAENYQGISIMYAVVQVFLSSQEFYALAGNLGYEGQPYTVPFMSPSTLSIVHTGEGSTLAEGEVPVMPPPPPIVRAEYGRVHLFGDSMLWLVNKTGVKKAVSATLKNFLFWNMTDRSRVGAKVADITEQIRDFFLDWRPADITGTVVPKGTQVHHTNVVPPLVQHADQFMFDEYHAPTHELIHMWRPRHRWPAAPCVQGLRHCIHTCHAQRRLP